MGFVSRVGTQSLFSVLFIRCRVCFSQGHFRTVKKIIPSAKTILQVTYLKLSKCSLGSTSALSRVRSLFLSFQGGARAY